MGTGSVEWDDPGAGGGAAARRPMRAVLIGLVALSLGLAGCATDEGSTSTSAGDTAPAATLEGAIPEPFPEPPEITDYDELTATDEDIQVQWEIAATVDQAVAHYDDALPETGWEVLSRRTGGDSTRYRIEGHDWTGAVTVLGGDPVKVLLQLGRP